MTKDPDKYDTEVSRKKVKTVDTFPDAARVVHNIRQRSYVSLNMGKDRDEGETNT